jgi:hypothetical protein
MTDPVNAPRRARAPAALLLIATLSACGGGGGDSAPAPAPAPAPVQISSANANTTAARGYETATALFDASSAASGQLKSAAGGPRLDLVRFSLARLQSLTTGQPGSSAGSGVPSAKATSTETLQCPGGGSISVSATDQNDNGRLDASDSASITFNACVADGATVSGSMAFVFQSFTSTATVDTSSTTATFTNLSVTADGQTSSASGDMTLAATVSKVSPFTADVTLSGSRLALTEDGRSRTLTGYSGRLLIDDTRRTYSYTVSGSVSGSALPGSVTLSTPTAISGPLAGDPTAGRLLVTGAANSQMSLTVTPPTGVVLALDANGDGTPESQQPLTWAQLEAL